VVEQSSNNPPPGWHPDPADPSQLRWWDGSAWTNDTHPLPQDSKPQSDNHGLAKEKQLSSASDSTGNLDEDKADKQGVNRRKKSDYNASRFVKEQGRKATTLGSAIIGVIVLLATSVVVGLYGVAIFIFALPLGVGLADGASPYFASLFIVVTAFIGLAISLWFIGWLTSVLFRMQDYRFSSRWNLIIAYPIASLVVSFFFFVVQLLLFTLVGNEKDPSQMIVVAGSVFSIVAALFIFGKLLSWVSLWPRGLAQALTLIYIAGYLLITIIVAFAFAKAGQLIGNFDQFDNLGNIGNLAKTNSLNDQEAKSVSKGTTLAEVKRRLGKPLTEEKNNLSGNGAATCLIYKAEGDQLLAAWQFCFDGASPQSRLIAVSKLSS